MKTQLEINPDCRAELSKRIITNSFARCLMDNPQCTHHLVYNNVTYCFHPYFHQIINQTRVTP